LSKNEEYIALRNPWENSTGTLNVAIAVFVSDSVADEVARESVIAKISRAAWDNWAGEAPQAERNRQ
jgi:hypothetical protein